MQYSERLGSINNAQFQKALDKFNLGLLTKTEKILFGNFGQNIFLTTTKGNFVLRGKPHYSWQFKNEKLMVDLLHEKTNTKVPHPYLIDENTDIFGWSYVIMPRLGGRQLIDKNEQKNLTLKDWKEIASAYAINLIEMHKLTYKYSGKYTDNYIGIKPFSPSFSSWIIQSINILLDKSSSYNKKTTEQDKKWITELLNHRKEALEEPFKPTFTMQDYQITNTLVDKVDGQWIVTGVFDFMESYFGDCEVDLSRMFLKLHENDKELAYIFLNTYLRRKKIRRGFSDRFAIYIVLDRLLVWEWAQRTGKLWWDPDMSLSDWCKRYTKLDKNYLGL
ncbi:MAG: phosphotransferase protein [uncultured bacterium]|nr:MAG: phosphotransferase protein [uncultured bacterium]